MNPLDNKEFRHFLNFINDGHGRIEISEPIKFDGAEFVLEQDGYARDVSFMSEEIDLEFYKGFFEQGASQVLPNGIVVDRLGHGIEYLFEYYKRYGFESDIQYILQRNDTDFILGNLNFQEAETDELTYIKCKVVQNTDRAILKRREGIKVDVFSDVDLDDNPITPLSTENILLKAKPVIQTSNWDSPNTFDNERLYADDVTDTLYYYYNNCQQVVNGNIEDTLSFFDQVRTSTSEDFDIASDFAFLEAKNDLNDITITIKDLDFSQIIDTDNGGDGYSDNYFKIIWGESLDNPYNEIIIDQSYVTDSDGSYSFSIEEQIYEIASIPRGYRLWIFFRSKVRQSSDTPFGNPRIEAFTSISKYSIEIVATSTSIDSVVKGVRYIDLLKQSVKSCSGLNVNAPKYEFGGEFYDQFAFSGNLIRQFTDEPFYVTYKDRRENLLELNADCQVNDDEVYVGQYNDFYHNVDNGGFLMSPNDNFSTKFNEKYAINQFEYSYKNYEKDRDEENTVDAVHTETQWLIPNKQVQNTKKIDIGDIRDPFLIESQRRQAIKETTALETDNKIFVLDVVPLSPSATGSFTSGLIHKVNDDGYLQLLNDATYNWGLLGFDVGGVFYITSEENFGNYEVVEITNNVITLNSTGAGTPQDYTYVLTTVAYPYTNVAWTNRTNEGFDVIQGVENEEKFSNLRYTIKRNLDHWKSYMATACKYTEQSVKNTFWQNNNELVTQYNGGDLVDEDASLSKTDLGESIVNPKLYETTVIAEYDDVLELMQKYQDEATIGGFIRCQDNNGAVVKLYPMKLGYTWATKKLSIIGEQRNESDYVEITSDNGLLIINEVGYDLDILQSVFYRITNNYIILFDENNVNLINLTKYDRISVNGQTFSNINDLAEALNNL